MNQYLVTKRYTLLQLLSIVDGRLATTIDDVQDILSHLTGRSILTHEIPFAMKQVSLENPTWYDLIKIERDVLSGMHNDDFIKMINFINNDRELTDLRFDIPPLLSALGTSHR